MNNLLINAKHELALSLAEAKKRKDRSLIAKLEANLREVDARLQAFTDTFGSETEYDEWESDMAFDSGMPSKYVP